MKLCQISAGTVPPLTLPSELVVVAADPHADDQVAGETDEQGIAVFLRVPVLPKVGTASAARRPVPLLAAA